MLQFVNRQIIHSPQVGCTALLPAWRLKSGIFQIYDLAFWLLSDKRQRVGIGDHISTIACRDGTYTVTSKEVVTSFPAGIAQHTPYAISTTHIDDAGRRHLASGIKQLQLHGFRRRCPDLDRRPLSREDDSQLPVIEKERVQNSKSLHLGDIHKLAGNCSRPRPPVRP